MGAGPARAGWRKRRPRFTLSRGRGQRLRAGLVPAARPRCGTRRLRPKLRHDPTFLIFGLRRAPQDCLAKA